MNAYNQFCQLAHFGKRGAHINYQGLKIIDYYDNLAIVTVEGGLDNKLKSSMIDSKTRTQINSADDGVWISKYPKYDHRISKYIIILRVISQDDEIFQIAHTFCSLISNLIVLVWSDVMNFGFLGTINMKMGEVPGDASKKIAALLTLPKHNPNDSVSFNECLAKQGLGYRNFQHFYPYVTSCDDLQRSEVEHLLSSGGSMIQNLFKIRPNIEDQTLMKNYGNQELSHGTVTKSYIENLIQTYNQNGIFNVMTAEDNIEVEEQFQDYLLAIQKYNTKVKGRLNNQPIQNIGEVTKDIRQQIENEHFYKNSPYYAEKITVYMDRKQQELSKLNDELYDSKNLNLLQNLSGQALRNVRKGKNTSPDLVNKQLNNLVNRYNDKAIKTSNKDKLLTEFLEVFTPNLFQQSKVEEHIDAQNSRIERENQKLRSEISKLQKKYKKQGKCCAIM